MNECQFSPCRLYRYTLKHRWETMFPEKAIMWIGLNPSTADETNLDPTLRRIRAFSQRWGYNCFVMTNLFGFRATDPEDMRTAADPVGPDNDERLRQTAARCDRIIAAWGVHGTFLDRADTVMRDVLPGRTLECLQITKDGFPKHPLYCAGNLSPVRYRIGIN